MRDIEQYLVKNIGQKRYEHSLRVVETALRLAKLHNIDPEKAKIAGLLHDCAKIRDRASLLKKASSFDIINDIVLKENTELIHAHLGAEVARREFMVKDEDILNAIRYHTTGRVAMSGLEKIIFLADYIEPMRNFPGVENVRHLAELDLDLALLKAMDQTLVFLISKESLISKETIEARNYLIMEK